MQDAAFVGEERQDGTAWVTLRCPGPPGGRPLLDYLAGLAVLATRTQQRHLWDPDTLRQWIADNAIE